MAPFPQKIISWTLAEFVIPENLEILFHCIPEFVLTVINPTTGKNRAVPVYCYSLPEVITWLLHPSW
jgi:hypothetical protein